MPYRLSGNCVEVHKGGRWRLLKRHPSVQKARRHLAALKINVPEAKLGSVRKAKMIAASKPVGLEEKVRRVRDSDYWGLPPGTPITPGMRPRGRQTMSGRSRAAYQRARRQGMSTTQAAGAARRAAKKTTAPRSSAARRNSLAPLNLAAYEEAETNALSDQAVRRYIGLRNNGVNHFRAMTRAREIDERTAARGGATKRTPARKRVAIPTSIQRTDGSRIHLTPDQRMDVQDLENVGITRYTRLRGSGMSHEAAYREASTVRQGGASKRAQRQGIMDAGVQATQERNRRIVDELDGYQREEFGNLSSEEQRAYVRRVADDEGHAQIMRDLLARRVTARSADEVQENRNITTALSIRERQQVGELQRNRMSSYMSLRRAGVSHSEAMRRATVPAKKTATKRAARRPELGDLQDITTASGSTITAREMEAARRALGADNTDATNNYVDLRGDGYGHMAAIDIAGLGPSGLATYFEQYGVQERRGATSEAAHERALAVARGERGEQETYPWDAVRMGMTTQQTQEYDSLAYGEGRIGEEAMGRYRSARYYGQSHATAMEDAHRYIEEAEERLHQEEEDFGYLEEDEDYGDEDYTGASDLEALKKARENPQAHPNALKTLVAEHGGGYTSLSGMPDEVAQTFVTAFETSYGDYRTELTTVNLGSGGTFSVEGDVKDENGNGVGTFELYLKYGEGRPNISFSYFRMDAGVQGQGIADAFIKQAFIGMQDQGIGSVSINADIDVGKYAWARKGFGWTGDRMPANMRRHWVNNLAAMLDNDEDLPDDDEYKLPADLRDDAENLIDWINGEGDIAEEMGRDPTPGELAGFGEGRLALPDRVSHTGVRIKMWPGKSIMLAGPNWNGTLVIPEPSEEEKALGKDKPMDFWEYHRLIAGVYGEADKAFKPNDYLNDGHTPESSDWNIHVADMLYEAPPEQEKKDIHTGSVSGTTTLGFGRMQRDKLVGRQYRPGHRPATRAALIARSGKRRQRKRRERRESKGMEFKAHRGPVVRHVRDPEYWDQPYGAVIVRGTVLPHVGPQPLEESEVWAGITWDKYTGADGTEWMVADISPPGGKADWVAMTRHQFDKWSGENIADIEKMPKLRFNDPARSKVQLQASLLKKMNTQSKVKQARDGFRFATDDEAKEVGASTAAFTDIQIPEDPDSPIKWIGYSKSNRAVATTRKVDAESETDARKFHRIAALSTQIHKLERTLGRDAQTDDAALAVLIMRLTGQRHGGGEHGSGKGKTYATTTLLRKHVSIDSQGYVRFNYYGKNKEHIKVKSNDPDLVRAMKKRMRGKQPSDRLFPNLTQAKTTTYFRGKVGKYPPSVTGEHSNFKIHDLRTLYANEMANEFLSQVRRKPKSEAQFRKLVERISTQVAPLMGHTTVKKGKEVPNWTTTRNSYINPTVWDVLEPHPAWLKGWGKAGEKLEATAHQIREGELE